MTSRWCTSCGDSFVVRPQVPAQAYCSKGDCQRERRRLWQQAKRISDPDYLENQALAQTAWSKRDPDYWRRYRKANPDYTDRNREKQRVRNMKRRESIANEDVSGAASLLASGTYRVTVVKKSTIAKEDVWLVEMRAKDQPG